MAGSPGVVDTLQHAPRACCAQILHEPPYPHLCVCVCVCACVYVRARIIWTHKNQCDMICICMQGKIHSMYIHRIARFQGAKSLDEHCPISLGSVTVSRRRRRRRGYGEREGCPSWQGAGGSHKHRIHSNWHRGFDMTKMMPTYNVHTESISLAMRYFHTAPWTYIW